MPELTEVARFLDHFLAIDQYTDDQHGVYGHSARLIQRIGLALEPWPGLRRWAEQERLDALFLHRPWRLEAWHLPADVGVLAYHLAFDEHLTLGYNLRLASALCMTDVAVVGEKAGRPIGMLGATPALNFAAFARVCGQLFAGYDVVQANKQQDVSQVAVVGAMTDTLVREAAARGANVYVTGQFREPGRGAVAETGIGVLVVGHRRSEQWGLRTLAGVLRERWAGLTVVLPPLAEG